MALTMIVPAMQLKAGDGQDPSLGQGPLLMGINPLAKQRFFLNLDDFRDITIWKDGGSIVLTADDIWNGLEG